MAVFLQMQILFLLLIVLQFTSLQKAQITLSHLICDISLWVKSSTVFMQFCADCLFSLSRSHKVAPFALKEWVLFFFPKREETLC